MLTLDNSSSAEAASVNTLSWNHAIGGGANRLLVIQPGVIANSLRTVTGVTFNGIACIQVRSDDNATNRRCEIWYMDEADLPVAGTYVITVTFSGNGTLKGGAISVAGANQGGAEVNHTGAFGWGASHAQSITTVNDNAWVFQHTLLDGDYALTPDNGQTEHYELQGFADHQAGATLEVATAGAVTMGYSWSTSDTYVVSMAEWAPVSTAAFSEIPTATPQTDGYDVDFTITITDGTVYAVAVLTGATPPNAAQIIAGTDGDDNAALATASRAAMADVPDSLSLTGLTFPVHDVYLVVDTDTATLANEQKLPPAGYQYQTVTLAGAPPANSLLDAGAVTGDIWELSATVSPSTVGVTSTADGYLSLNDPVTGRQHLLHRQYDVSAQDWFAVTGQASGSYAAIWLNNQAPTELQPIINQQWFIDIAITPIRLDAVHVQDGENDTLSYALDVALPAGVTINETSDENGTYKQISGAPNAGTEGATSHAITVTDVAGDTLVMTSFNVTVGAGVQVPAVDDQLTSLSAAIAAIEAAGLVVGDIQMHEDSSVALGNVISCEPSGGSWVATGSQVTLIVSGIAYPNVVGSNEASAIAAIETLGFFVSLTRAFDETVQAGDVISQDPEFGGIGSLDETVSIVVSYGSQFAAPVEVPQIDASKTDGDIALVPGDDGITLDVALAENGLDLKTDRGLETAVRILLMTDRRADNDDELPGAADDRRGWWGDSSLGSKRWLLARAKETQDTLNRARDYDTEALQPLIDNGVASSVQVSTAWSGRGVLNETVIITRPDGRQVVFGFQHLWGAIK